MYENFAGSFVPELWLVSLGEEDAPWGKTSIGG